MKELEEHTKHKLSVPLPPFPELLLCFNRGAKELLWEGKLMTFQKTREYIQNVGRCQKWLIKDSE